MFITCDASHGSNRPLVGENANFVPLGQMSSVSKNFEKFQKINYTNKLIVVNLFSLDFSTRWNVRAESAIEMKVIFNDFILSSVIALFFFNN